MVNLVKKRFCEGEYIDCDILWKCIYSIDGVCNKPKDKQCDWSCFQEVK